MKIKSYESDKISLSQVILESGEYYIIKLLVIHKTNKIHEIKSFRKIAGQKRISVVNSIDIKDDPNFWQKVYQGNIWVQLLRLLSYFLAVLLVIVLILVISEKIDTVREKKRRRKLISDFKSLKSYEYTRMDDAIFDRYQEKGAHSFNHMQKLLKDENELNKIYTKLSQELKSKEFRRFRKLDSETRIYYERDDWSLINEMTSDGIIFKENSKLTINQAMTDTLNKFVKFLKENKEFKKNWDLPFLHEENENMDEEKD